jgi:hypothetical protein
MAASSPRRIARYLRRAWRRSRLDPLLPRGRARLRILLALSGADRPPRRCAGRAVPHFRGDDRIASYSAPSCIQAGVIGTRLELARWQLLCLCDAASSRSRRGQDRLGLSAPSRSPSRPVSRARPLGTDPLRQLCPGPHGQARPGSPQHYDERLVSADLSDPPRGAPVGRAEVPHHPQATGLPPPTYSWLLSAAQGSSRGTT